MYQYVKMSVRVYEANSLPEKDFDKDAVQSVKPAPQLLSGAQNCSVTGCSAITALPSVREAVE